MAAQPRPATGELQIKRPVWKALEITIRGSGNYISGISSPTIRPVGNAW